MKLTVGGPELYAAAGDRDDDPRVQGVKPDDLQKQFDLAMQVRNANKDLHRAVNQVRTMRAEIKAMHSALTMIRK